MSHDNGNKKILKWILRFIPVVILLLGILGAWYKNYFSVQMNTTIITEVKKSTESNKKQIEQNTKDIIEIKTGLMYIQRNTDRILERLDR